MARVPDERRLRRTVSDLVAVSTLPAVWAGLTHRRIAEELADVLLRTLGLEFAYIRVTDQAREQVLEVSRVAERPQRSDASRVVRQALAHWLDSEAPALPTSIPNPAGGGPLRLATLSLGLGGECGLLVAASPHEAFPTEDDRLLMGVAANQATTLLRCKQTEEALQLSEQRFAGFMNHLPGLAWIKDAIGRYVYVNDAAERAFRKPRADVYGRTDAEIFPAATAARFQESDRRAREREAGIVTFESLDGDDGVPHHSLVSKFPIPCADADAFLVGGIAIDVTGWKKAEESLRQSEERLRLALEAGGMGTWDWDIATNQIRWSPELGAIHGLDPGTSVGTLEAYLENVHPEDHEHVLRSIRGSLDQGEEYPTEYRRIWPDGSIHWVEGRGRLCRDASGKPVRVVGLCSDITERKRQSLRQQRLADAALRISASLSMARSLKATLQVVSDAAAEIVGAHMAAIGMTVDQNWAQAVQAVTLSDKYAAWWGYDEAPDGTGIYSLVCRDNTPMRLTQEELLRHPAFRGFGKAADRHPPMRGWLCVPLVGGDGRNLGALHLSDKYAGEFTAEDEAIAVQLAAMAAVAVENHNLYEDVKAADRRKDEFLATLSHELRNPLAPIRTAVQLLRTKGPPEPELQWARDVIDRQVVQMTRLVEDLLDVSRISRGKVVLRKEAVDLATIVGRAVETTRPLIEERRHGLIVALPPAPVRLEADPVRLEQVLGNLLTNAAKYTEPGGRIWLSAERENGSVAVRVRDTGIGMSPEFVRQAFEMFTQAEQGRDLTRGGLGIGLALVRSLVKMHGGSIIAQSAGLNQGSEFTVRLPALPEERSAPDASRPQDRQQERPTGATRRILIVDDNKDTVDALAMLLRLNGHDVHTSYDGSSALEAVGAYKPDLVLLDIGLPGMDGHDVARRIRQQPGLEAVVLVAVTGWGQEEDRRRSKEAGFDHHIVKPIDPDAIRELAAALKPDTVA